MKVNLGRERKIFRLIYIYIYIFFYPLIIIIYYVLLEDYRLQDELGI